MANRWQSDGNVMAKSDSDSDSDLTTPVTSLSETKIAAANVDETTHPSELRTALGSVLVVASNSALQSVTREDFKQRQQQIGHLDFDPICECTETDYDDLGCSRVAAWLGCPPCGHTFWACDPCRAEMPTSPFRGSCGDCGHTSHARAVRWEPLR